MEIALRSPRDGRQPWQLTEESLNLLLRFLDPNPSSAAAHYESVREKLVRFFEWRGCIPGDVYADETFDRVARKLSEGLESQPGNPYLYFHGVAVNLVRERWRKADQQPRSLESVKEPNLPAFDPSAESEKQSSDRERERRLGCLRDCMDNLPSASRELLRRYHLEESKSSLARRNELAAALNVGPGALRIRVFRIRRQLERCMTRCLARAGKPAWPESKTF
jgi:DNA-directed RNA polymerase specialized sigma24 family protein